MAQPDEAALGGVTATAVGTRVAPEGGATLHMEARAARDNVVCPTCSVGVGQDCTNRPEYPGQLPVHRPRIGAYRTWLAGGGSG